MLPTTGHFKNISCPFYDACICERPYCHFKHSKRETLNDTNLISELVSKAVHKVLNRSKHSQAETNEKPTEAPNNGDGKNIIYNPTPLSELKKFKNNNSSPKENSEKKNRHIPIQYTPEQPRSFRSPIANSSCSSNSLEYNLAESKNAGYSPSSNILSLKTPVSYIPSLIKTLIDNSPTNSVNSSQTIINTHHYVPFNLSSEDLQTDTFRAEYNPTKNLSLDDSPTYVEYVPKYNDEFIDDFLNDPNMYEPTEITSSVHDKVDTKSDKKEIKSDKSEINKRADTSHLSEVDKKDKNKSRKDKNSLDSSKSSSSSSKKSSDDNSRSSSKSKHSNKSRHKDKRKDRGKDDEQTNGCEKEHKNNEKVHKNNDKKQKNYDKKHNNNQRRSRSRDRHRKTIRNSNSSNKREFTVNINKVSKDTKISEKSKLKESSDDDRDHSPVLDICDKEDVEVDIEGLSDESDDELEQCKRIFEEYQPPTEIVQSKKQPKPEPVENVSVSAVSKKRVAHEKSSTVSRKPTVKPLAVKTAALVNN